MESLLPLIIQALGGAAGGNLAGSLLKSYSMGTLWNSVLGILGGGLGGQLLGGMLSSGGDGGMNLMSILSNVASGCVGGGVLMFVVGLIRSMLSKQG